MMRAEVWRSARFKSKSRWVILGTLPFWIPLASVGSHNQQEFLVHGLRRIKRDDRFKVWAGETTAQLLKALAAVAEGPGSVPSTHMGTHNALWDSRGSNVFKISLATPHTAVHITFWHRHSHTLENNDSFRHGVWHGGKRSASTVHPIFIVTVSVASIGP